ncbi:hypothetical protein F443_15430 [Phytophthora nicotianae P1569]|uniref:Uncharacterized protein n=1 Tax=Phytophthora nicotianae P1569 TaxID=1317065 RepID=V9EJ14_PHYNI|nr:hypothetical protein F443_15430 [Phytophthora nicotianae P1569]
MTKTQSTTNVPEDDNCRDTRPIFTPYEEAIRNRAKGGTDGKVVPIKTTFDEGLPRMWCRLRWRLSIDDVADELILTEIDKIISSVKNNSVPDVDHETREMLRMDLSESDVSERVIQYFKLCHDIIHDHGRQQFFTGKDGRQQLCRVLIVSLEPHFLQEEVVGTVW